MNRYLSIYFKYIKIFDKRYGKPASFKDKKPNLHIHHITPKNDGGTDEIDNLVYCKPREHFLLHWNRWKALGSKTDADFIEIWRKKSKNKRYFQQQKQEKPTKE